MVRSGGVGAGPIPTDPPQGSGLRPCRAPPGLPSTQQPPDPPPARRRGAGGGPSTLFPSYAEQLRLAMALSAREQEEAERRTRQEEEELQRILQLSLMEK